MVYNIKTNGKLVFRENLLSNLHVFDIFDKFILFFLSGERFSSGRMFAHSLLFVLLLFALGAVVLRAYRKSWVLVLAACCLFHQLLDIMWKQLNIYFWPVNNLLPQKSIQTLAPDILNMPVRTSEVIKGELTWSAVGRILSDPYIYVSEIVGALILLGFFILLVSRKQVMGFLKTGKVWK